MIFMQKARVIRSKLVKWYEPPLHTKTIAKDLVTPETAGSSNIAVRMFIMEPSATAEKHSHEIMEHAFMILKGEAIVTCGDETHYLKEGDVIYIPPKVEHSFNNTSNEPVIVLALYSPPSDKK
jgi:quercetin dioxygenase-like cupin family protein